VYKGETPFVFETDTYGGLKEASQIHAQAILKGDYVNTTLLPISDSLKLYKTLTKTTKLICATGLEARSPFGKAYLEYNHDTAEIKAGSNIYGFGIAYPSVTIKDSKKYLDVSVLSFQAHIQKCLSTFL
jgi:hypothetical protein